jgi:transcriptional regulator
MGDSAPDYIDGMVRAIVGIEVLVTRLEGKSKLSQNREPRDVRGAVDSLRARGVLPMAQSMEHPPKS